MTKAVSLSLGFIFLLAPMTGFSASTSAEDAAVNQAVLNQANTIVLRQKLVDAKNAESQGDLLGAAKLYEDAYALVEQIGSGIGAETAQTISGLTSTRLELARRAQSRGDLLDADKEVSRVLKVNPKDSAARAFKKQNDQMISAMRGKVPDPATIEQIPVVAKQRTDAGTLVQDGKLFYEMGKLDDAEAKFNQALKLDPDNRAAFYYLNLVKQAHYSRSENRTELANSDRVVEVQRAWEKPRSGLNLTAGNPYATTNTIYTGPGRQAIVSKLDRIRLDNVIYDGLPLSEVIRNLSEQSKLRDPDKRGINFLINPNAEASVPAVSNVPGFPGGAPPAVDPATGLPIAAAQTGGGEQVDVGSVIIKINPPLTDVRMADVLDAIVQVADHPIKYTIEDYAIVFSSRGPATAQLSMRTFKVDPNTFYSGLESVSSSSFGSANNSGSGGSGGGGSSGGGGGSSGGNNTGGSVIAVVNASPGAGGFRSTGGSGGGGGGGGGSGQGVSSPVGNVGGLNGANGGGGGGGNTAGANGGLRYVTTPNLASDVSLTARAFFTTLGVDMNNPPGKSVFFNDRLGLLFVKATDQDLDTIERAIQALNQVAPQVHIKARFIEITQLDNKALGFNWYMGQFGSTVTASGGSEGSQNVPVSAANPLGTFPGSTTASQIAGAASDQLITGGLRNQLGAPAIATVTGILTDPNFRVVINALQQRSGVETLAEPEVTTTSGRQTQMRATTILTIVSGVSFQQGAVGGTGTTTGTP